jgi:hypothetical protein
VGQVIAIEGPGIFTVRFTGIGDCRIREEHLEHILTQPPKAVGGPAERALGQASFLIRKDGSIAALVEAPDGPLTVHGKAYALSPLGYLMDQLVQAINYWTCFCARMDGIRDALRRDAITVPDARLAAVKFVSDGKHQEDDHAVEVRPDGTVHAVLYVPAFALLDRNGQYHAYPDMRVTTQVSMSNGRPQSERTTWMWDCPIAHPFANPEGPICLNQVLPEHTGDEGAFIAALLLLAKDVLRTGWKADGSGPQARNRLDGITDNIISKEEVRRRELPVTNA